MTLQNVVLWISHCICTSKWPWCPFQLINILSLFLFFRHFTFFLFLYFPMDLPKNECQRKIWSSPWWIWVNIKQIKIVKLCVNLCAHSFTIFLYLCLLKSTMGMTNFPSSSMLNEIEATTHFWLCEINLEYVALKPYMDTRLLLF